jgi:two-component system, cell cycle sensor histidine kinase and response regulator CckA
MEASLPSGTETILLVEDEPHVRLVARSILTHAGYRVLEASGGSDALHIGERHADHIDLLLTDIVMPQVNARELAQQIRSLRPGIKVLFMSGYTASVIESEAILDSGAAFIEKPFTPSTLTVKVREVLDTGHA